MQHLKMKHYSYTRNDQNPISKDWISVVFFKFVPARSLCF
uniref:Uncharacterized protein n=1 Tax=Arundo donax TaxID=35708 RepID=A0A0A9B0G4_ARUDO